MFFSNTTLSEHFMEIFTTCTLELASKYTIWEIFEKNRRKRSKNFKMNFQRWKLYEISRTSSNIRIPRIYIIDIMRGLYYGVQVVSVRFAGDRTSRNRDMAEETIGQLFYLTTYYYTNSSATARSAVHNALPHYQYFACYPNKLTLF